jgi:hypothetical protein
MPRIAGTIVQPVYVGSMFAVAAVASAPLTASHVMYTKRSVVRPRQDPDAAADRVLTLRVTAAEGDALDVRLRHKNDALKKMGFPPVLTRASYIRSLLVRDLEEAGLLGSGRLGELRVEASPIEKPATKVKPKRASRGKSIYERVLDDVVVETKPARRRPRR